MSGAKSNSLAHYGVKGMRWGFRKSEGPTGVTVSQVPGKRVKAVGGTKQSASEDAKAAAGLRQKAKASTTDSLSNQELQALVTRMNLEQQYTRLSAPTKSKGRQFVSSLFQDVAKQNARRVVNDVASQQIAEAMKKAKA